MDFPLTCPLCGSREICTAGRGEHQTEYGLHCSSCGYEGWGETMDAAIRQWETEVQYEANPCSFEPLREEMLWWERGRLKRGCERSD